MIIAILSFYNEEKKIGKCLDSICPVVDKVIAIDGMTCDTQFRDRCFFEIPKLMPFSTDSSKDIILEKSLDYNIKLIHPRRIGNTYIPWYHQNEKRNIGVAEAGIGDWCFQVDADEQLMGKTETLRKQLELAKEDSIKIVVKRPYPPNDDYSSPKFYRKREGMHFCRNHFSMVDGKHNDMTSARGILSDIYIWHESDVRQ